MNSAAALALDDSHTASAPAPPLRRRGAWSALGSTASVHASIAPWQWGEFKRLANEAAYINGLRVDLARRSTGDRIEATAQFAGSGPVEWALVEFRASLRLL